MRNTLGTLALAAALATGASGIAFAQSCPPGYMLQGAYCQPAPMPAYGYAPSNPVTGAASGAAAGAAAGGAAAGPVGAIVGGALGTATGAVAGTVNAVAPYPVYGSGYPAPAPACSPGYTLYNGGCYPAR